MPACHAGGRGFESRPYANPQNQAISSYSEGFLLALSKSYVLHALLSSLQHTPIFRLQPVPFSGKFCIFITLAINRPKLDSHRDLHRIDSMVPRRVHSLLTFYTTAMTKTWIRKTLACLLALFLSTPVIIAGGKKILFTGDSITDGNWEGPNAA